MYIADVRNPIAQLMTMCSKAERSLQSAVDKQEKKRKSEAEASLKKASAGPVVNPLFEVGAALATQMERFSLEGVKKANLSKPFVVALTELVGDIMAKGGPCEDVMRQFKAGFETKRKGFPGLRLADTINDGADDFLRERLVDGATAPLQSHEAVLGVHSPECKALLANLRGSIYGIDVGYNKVSGEAAGMSALRVTTEGTRLVIIAKGQHLHGFMRRKGVAGPFPTDRIASFMRSMSAALLKEFTKECCLWSTTLTAGDLLYLPYGCVVAERVGGTTFGFRIPVVVRDIGDDTACSGIELRMAETEKVMLEVAGDAAVKQRATVEMGLLHHLSTAVKAKVRPERVRGDVRGLLPRDKDGGAAATEDRDGREAVPAPEEPKKEEEKEGKEPAEPVAAADEDLYAGGAEDGEGGSDAELAAAEAEPPGSSD